MKYFFIALTIFSIIACSTETENERFTPDERSISETSGEEALDLRGKSGDWVSNIDRIEIEENRIKVSGWSCYKSTTGYSGFPENFKLKIDGDMAFSKNRNLNKNSAEQAIGSVCSSLLGSHVGSGQAGQRTIGGAGVIYGRWTLDQDFGGAGDEVQLESGDDVKLELKGLTYRFKYNGGKQVFHPN